MSYFWVPHSQDGFWPQFFHQNLCQAYWQGKSESYQQLAFFHQNPIYNQVPSIKVEQQPAVSKIEYQSPELQKPKSRRIRLNSNFDFECYSIPNRAKDKNFRSNVLRYFLTYVRSVSQRGNKIENLFRFHSLAYSRGQFMKEFNRLVKVKRYYCSVVVLQNLLENEQASQCFRKVLRILLRIFFKSDFRISLKQTSRLRRENQLMYFSKSCEVYDQVLKPIFIRNNKGGCV